MKWGKLAPVLICALLLSGCSAFGFEEPTALGTPAGAKSTGDFEPLISSSFDEPWSTDVTRQEMIETALFRLFADLDQIKDSNCQVKPVLYLGEPLLEEHHPLLEQIAFGMVSSFCDYLSEDIPVVAGSYEFLKQVMASEGLEGDEFGGNCGFDLVQDWASACAVYGVAWTGISLGTVRDGVSFVEERRLTIAAHELFHIVHDQINPQADPGTGSCLTYGCAGPVWFYEGAGEFFGRAMTQYLGLQNYATFVPTDRNGLYLDVDYLSDLDFLTPRRNKAGGVENYYSGQIAMEYMLANNGLIAVLAIWERMDEGVPFPAAFESEMGISLEDFYSKFKVLHSRLYDEAGYCNEGLGCEEWIKSDQTQDWYSGQNSQDNPDPSLDNERLLSNECLSVSAIWWAQCTELELGIPESPENSDHGYPLDYNMIAKIESCDEMELIGFDLRGWAVTFEARELSGASQANVSTQYYAALRYLDTNQDGVLCSPQVPD